MIIAAHSFPSNRGSRPFYCHEVTLARLRNYSLEEVTMLGQIVGSGFVLWDYLEYEVSISRKSASSRLCQATVLKTVVIDKESSNSRVLGSRFRLPPAAP